MEEEERTRLADACVDEIVHDYGNTILHSSARNEYMVQRLKRMVRRTVWALQEQIKRGEFTPSRFEVSFAMADSLESVNIALSEHETMKLKGRIDRIDVCEDEEHVYVKVIDYKSGNTSFDLVALYHGLQLQLALYLNAAVELEQKAHPYKQVVPAGIFYYNMKDPVVGKLEEEDLEDLKRRILKELRMNGIAVSDAKVLQKLDEELVSGKRVASSVVPVSLNKDGSVSKTSGTASEKQFDTMQSYVNYKIRSIGRSILDGEVGTAPYELGNRNACQYCPYQSVCGFDEKIGGYHYRRLAALKPEDIWVKMQEVTGKEEGHGSTVDEGTATGH